MGCIRGCLILIVLAIVCVMISLAIGQVVATRAVIDNVSLPQAAWNMAHGVQTDPNVALLHVQSIDPAVEADLRSLATILSLGFCGLGSFILGVVGILIFKYSPSKDGDDSYLYDIGA